MNLAPTAEQQELAANARRFLEKEITRERLLAWDKTREGYDDSFWRAIEELGWIGFCAGQAGQAGQGGSFVDAAVILEECGRAVAPAAIHAAIVGARAAHSLGAAVEGETALALRRRDGSRCDVRFGDGRLQGEAWYVRQGVSADRFLVLAEEGGEHVFCLVPADARGVSRRELETFGGDRQSVVTFDGVRTSDRLASGDAARSALARIESESAALALAEMVGGFAAVCDMTIAYVKERVQFNQPIGKFQAVQFRCADMTTALAATRHLAYAAIWKLSEGLDARRELAMARAFAGPAYKQATLDAHQLHGGAGYVVEHPLHRYAERAQSAAILFASEDAALSEIADTLVG